LAYLPERHAGWPITIDFGTARAYGVKASAEIPRKATITRKQLFLIMVTLHKSLFWVLSLGLKPSDMG
jgi:hypothetical protein